MKAITCAVLMLAILRVDASSPTQNYFPAGLLDSHKVEWYSKNLAALREPSIWAMSSQAGNESYRFLWLRTFHNPIAVRITIKSDKTGEVIVKESRRDMDFEPGRLMRNKKIRLTRRDTEWFLSFLEEQRFWSVPATEESDLIGLDGAQWILEGTRKGEYKFVERWSPDKGPVRLIGLEMLIGQGKLKLLYQDVY